MISFNSLHPLLHSRLLPHLLPLRHTTAQTALSYSFNSLMPYAFPTVLPCKRLILPKEFRCHIHHETPPIHPPLHHLLSSIIQGLFYCHTLLHLLPPLNQEYGEAEYLLPHHRLIHHTLPLRYHTPLLRCLPILEVECSLPSLDNQTNLMFPKLFNV